MAVDYLKYMGKFFKGLLVVLSAALILSGCGKSTSEAENSKLKTESETRTAEEEIIEAETEVIGNMNLKYAREFTVTYYDDDYALVSISDGSRYVVVPEGGEVKNLGFADATIIQRPCRSIYLAASSAMDLFRELDSLDLIKACSTTADDYAIAEAAERIENGDIKYVGKYSAPDYESLLQMDTDLVIESTMILHTPRVKEELESLEMPVLIDRSSYEAEPLGRLEWIKLYGLLTGKEEQAEAFFEEQIASIDDMDEVEEAERKSVVFFYISSNGYVNVRKPNDYISKMIAMAGGEYALDSIKIDEENALSTINISWEDFYVYAKDADILIYNKTVNDGISSIKELVDKNPMFEEFKAVQDGRVYCSTNNMYQEASKIGEMIVEMKKIMKGDNNNLKYICFIGED